MRSGEVDDDELEPQVPPGMSQLTPAQQALTEFLESDPDLLAAASEGGPDMVQSSDDGVDDYLKKLPNSESQAILKLLLQAKSQQAERQLKSGFFAWKKEQRPGSAPYSARRRASELWTGVEKAATLRLQRESEERARQDARLRKARESYLATLDFDRCWKNIDEQAARGTASGYEEAKRALVDLADAHDLKSSRQAFDQALHRFVVRNARRTALMRRLVDAGLWSRERPI
jgi:hypothetical protein